MSGEEKRAPAGGAGRRETDSPVAVDAPRGEGEASNSIPTMSAGARPPWPSGSPRGLGRETGGLDWFWFRRRVRGSEAVGGGEAEAATASAMPPWEGGLKTSRRGQRKPGARSAFGTLEGGVTLGPRVNEPKVFSFFF
jgi:hypothetical protein